MKIIRIKNHITVVLNDGVVLTDDNCTDEMYNKIVNNQEDESVVKSLLIPEFVKKEEVIEIKTKLLENFNTSKYITTFGNSVYIKSISELTVPEDLAVALFKAEQEKNDELIQSYLNFWTLASLNPDSRARTNLFWFLNRYGMSISKSGLFVAYRNVKLKAEGKNIKSDLADFISSQYIRVKTKLKKSPKNYYLGLKDSELSINVDYTKLDTVTGKLDELYTKLSDEEEAPIYTDAHSGKFTIKIGEVVSMPREDCDAIQENTCSRGLHVAGKQWLNKYGQGFGQISLMVLVNPADVVAVPPEDDYGKMRCCAYYPVQLIKRDKKGIIVDEDINDGFEDDFIEQIVYSGVVNDEDFSAYTIEIPEIPEINAKRIVARLQDISKSMKKYVN